MEGRASKDTGRIAVEAPLDPTLPICDAHHHLWRRPAGDYLLDELLRDLRSGHNIVSTVAIECRFGYRADGAEELKPIGETEFLESVANRVRADSTIEPRVAAAIVGHADLALGDAVAPVLEAHLAASPTHFRGIRHSTTWDQSDALRSDAPAGLLADRNFRRGFGRLQKLGLSFDAWLYHPQLPELADLARVFPGVTIVLDHIGAPLGVGPYAGMSREVYQAWSKGIATVAACPNVAVKLGGVGSSRSGYDWHERPVRPSSTELAEALKPYIERCIETFGVERCMFESNFPVEKSSNDYVNLWNAFKRIAEKYSDSERAALFHDTAARVYRIQKFVP
ncbi:MAG TPA: amidohydrolase family protein [Candidatus Binatia bacterium]|nr:amidohydrolase family protein [Candidatus Binatia bacterium]